MSDDAPIIEASGLCHSYGHGELRKQILFDVNVNIHPGEIVIMTGPSGSGKTTLLTLIGGLRSVQAGSLRVLGMDLHTATARERQAVRRQTGFIFQAHHLLPALTARQNVETALAHQPGWTAAAAHERAAQMLKAVGLEDRQHHLPSALSAGQRQRVAIARALAAKPRLILADEPTAALDKASGREVVDLMSRLARENGTPILIVTHDNRILDVADRILSLEEGRLSSFSQAFMTSSRNTLAALMRHGQKADLLSQVSPLPAHDFTAVMQRLSDQMEDVQDVLDLLAGGSLRPFLAMLLEVLGTKISQLVGAERGTVFLVDQQSGELWSLAVSGVGDKPVEIRLPPGAGIAGHVAASGRPMNVPDACSEPAFHAEVDRRTGFRTRNLLCVPLLGRGGRVVAVVQLLNKTGAPHFSTEDQQHFQNLAALLAGPVETWTRLSA